MRKLIILVLAILLFCSTVAHARLVGMSTTTDTVYEIDPATGAAEFLVHSGGDYSGIGLAFVGDELYATDLMIHIGPPWDFRLTTINMEAGGYTSINNQNGGINWDGLAYDEKAGLLYTIDVDSDLLESITPDGIITTIGSGTGIYRGAASGMAYDDGNEILYVAARHPEGDKLYTVDTTTGVATIIGSLGINFTLGGGLAYDEDNQILYLNSVGNNISAGGLYTIDINTGLATYIGPNGVDWISGLAWIQDVSTNFSIFNITEAKVKFKDNPNDDKFKIKGEFVLGDGNNGIDPIIEDVTVNVGTSSLVIPAPYSFVEEKAGVFKHKGMINSTDVEIEIKTKDYVTYNLKIKVNSTDLTDTSNPVDVGLAIGDDTGTATVRLKGELMFENK